MAAGEVLKDFHDAVKAHDIRTVRTYLHHDLVFFGLFETYDNTEEYLSALTKLLQIVIRLEVKTIIAERNEAARPPRADRQEWRQQEMHFQYNRMRLSVT